LDPRAGLDASEVEKKTSSLLDRFHTSQALSLVIVPTEVYVTFICSGTFKL
jgi:hypothetical protein